MEHRDSPKATISVVLRAHTNRQRLLRFITTFNEKSRVAPFKELHGLTFLITDSHLTSFVAF